MGLESDEEEEVSVVWLPPIQLLVPGKAKPKKSCVKRKEEVLESSRPSQQPPSKYHKKGKNSKRKNEIKKELCEKNKQDKVTDLSLSNARETNPSDTSQSTGTNDSTPLPSTYFFSEDFMQL